MSREKNLMDLKVNWPVSSMPDMPREVRMQRSGGEDNSQSSG